jgi:hypothetical protein
MSETQPLTPTIIGLRIRRFERSAREAPPVVRPQPQAIFGQVPEIRLPLQGYCIP